MTPNEVELFNKVIERVNGHSMVIYLAVTFTLIGVGLSILYSICINKRLDDLEAKQR
jgi:hypothetical protein